MNHAQQLQHEHFQAAKQLAFDLPLSTMRRATYNGRPTNYTAFKAFDGATYVIGDSDQDLQNPDARTENGQPMREVFEGATIMSK